jgi:hypothetical protein
MSVPERLSEGLSEGGHEGTDEDAEGWQDHCSTVYTPLLARGPRVVAWPTDLPPVIEHSLGSTPPVPLDLNFPELEEDPKEGYDADSLDYDTVYNTIYQSELRSMTAAQIAKQGYFRWVVIFMIGIATGLVAFLLDACTELLSSYKMQLTLFVESQCIDCFANPFGVWVGLAVALVMVTAIVVAFAEPVAAGSGIPEIKSYLNGVKIPRVVRLWTLVTKFLGTVFAVSSGLPLGKEGPMIHSGAILAAGISQGTSATVNFSTPFFRDFRNDTAKRDFGAGGAAAGIAAAFGAYVTFFFLPSLFFGFLDCGFLDLLYFFDALLVWGGNEGG